MDYKCFFRSSRCLYALIHAAMLAVCVQVFVEHDGVAPFYYNLKVGGSETAEIRPLTLSLITHVFGLLTNAVMAINPVAEKFVDLMVVRFHHNPYNWVFAGVNLIFGVVGIAFVIAVHRAETIALLALVVANIAQKGYYHDMLLRRDMDFVPEITPMIFNALSLAALSAVLLLRSLEILPQRGTDVRIVGLSVVLFSVALLLQSYFVSTRKKEAILSNIGNRHVRQLERIDDYDVEYDAGEEAEGAEGTGEEGENDELKTIKNQEISDLLDLKILENWHAFRYDALFNITIVAFNVAVTKLILRASD